MGPDWAIPDPVNIFKDQVMKFRNWMEGRHRVFLGIVGKDFDF